MAARLKRARFEETSSLRPQPLRIRDEFAVLAHEAVQTVVVRRIRARLRRHFVVAGTWRRSRDHTSLEGGFTQTGGTVTFVDDLLINDERQHNSPVYDISDGVMHCQDQLLIGSHTHSLRGYHGTMNQSGGDVVIDGYLSLAHTQITDAGLEHLEGLTNLQKLWLEGAQVTDAGLVHLKGLTNLRELHLRDAQVTDAGVKDLQEALPDCEILH